MSETKTAKLEQDIVGVQTELDEVRGVIGKLSREKNELATIIGSLNKDCANLRDAVKALQQWAKDQNDKTGRSSYANTSRY